MLQCLDALEEVNERLTGTLAECVNIIDRFLPLGDHETIWLDAYHDIQRLIAASEKIVQEKHELVSRRLISINPLPRNQVFRSHKSGVPLWTGFKRSCIKE